MLAISHFSDAQFNEAPYEGSWTAGMVVEHISKFEEGVLETLRKQSEPTERNPAEKVEQIESIFLDFSMKMTSPEFVEPTPGNKNRAEFVQRLERCLKSAREMAEANDLSLIYNSFSIPTMGDFTGVEWMAFFVAHTKRHIHQLNKIHQSLINRGQH